MSEGTNPIAFSNERLCCAVSNTGGSNPVNDTTTATLRNCYEFGASVTRPSGSDISYYKTKFQVPGTLAFRIIMVG